MTLKLVTPEEQTQNLTSWATPLKIWNFSFLVLVYIAEISISINLANDEHYLLKQIDWIVTPSAPMYLLWSWYLRFFFVSANQIN